jgi:hypothetical protein
MSDVEKQKEDRLERIRDRLRDLHAENDRMEHNDAPAAHAERTGSIQSLQEEHKRLTGQYFPIPGDV